MADREIQSKLLLMTILFNFMMPVSASAGIDLTAFRPAKVLERAQTLFSKKQETSVSTESLSIEMSQAKNLDQVVAVIKKIIANGLTLTERLVVYSYIPIEILDLRERLNAVSDASNISQDIPYAIEMTYLASVHSRIRQQDSPRSSKYANQEILSDRFLDTLILGSKNLTESWLALSDAESAASAQHADAGGHLINLADSFSAGMSDEERQSVEFFQMGWDTRVGDAIFLEISRDIAKEDRISGRTLPPTIEDFSTRRRRPLYVLHEEQLKEKFAPFFKRIRENKKNFKCPLTLLSGAL